MRRKMDSAQWQTSTALPSSSLTKISPRVTLLSPFTPRSSVDLPDPDRPISTQISPTSMPREAPATPTTLPVCFKMVGRSAPSSRSLSARSGALPKIMSTLWNSTTFMAGSSLRNGAGTLAHAIQHDGNNDDRQTSFKALSDVHRVQRTHDRLTQAVGTDQCSYNDH